MDSMSWTFQGTVGHFLSLAVEPNHVEGNSLSSFVPRVQLLKGGVMLKAGDRGKLVNQEVSKIIENYELGSTGTFKVSIGKEESSQPGPYRYKLCIHLSESEIAYTSSECASLR